MEVETQIIVVASVLGAAWLVLLLVAIFLGIQVWSLRKKLAEMQNANSKIRVQKLKMNNDKNHSFHNPALSPDEELSRRGYSMYMGHDSQSDVESGRYQPERLPERLPERPQERQTGGQFVEELMQKLDNRQTRQQSAPPFLLQSIQENKLKNKSNINPVANGPGRQSDTNPNFIY